MADSRSRGSGERQDPAAESSAVLLARARNGDTRAQNALFARYRPILMRIAHGRLPAASRGLLESDDLVQQTLGRAWRHIDGFEDRGEGAFLGYLAKILRNLIRDQWRSAKRHPGQAVLPDDFPAADRTPLEIAIGHDALAAYECALEELPEDQQHIVVLRVEFGFSHKEIAAALGGISPNAARMRVVRALEKLALIMQRRRGTP